MLSIWKKEIHDSVLAVNLGVQVEDMTEVLNGNINQERWKTKHSIVLSFKVIQQGENDTKSQEIIGNVKDVGSQGNMMNDSKTEKGQKL